MNKIKYFFLIITLFLLSACTSPPEGITAVKNFDLQKYQGKWYEIARLNHSFEEGMEQVTANYTINDDGTVKVINKGYITKEQQWKNAEGLAKFVGDSDIGLSIQLATVCLLAKILCLKSENMGANRIN